MSVNASTNQITTSGYSYDAAGEMLTDGSGNSYTWDAEGRQVTAGSGAYTYTYDGDGRRVEKSTGTLYWYGAGGSVLAETDTSGNTTNEYIFFDGGRIARRDSSGNVYYYFGDQIGSSRTITNGTGTICYDADFYPFGGELTFGTVTCGQNYKFAGMERDSETSHDHTMFRQYASNLGRWMSPDPLGGDITNPQSLNRYAYVANNPANFMDTFGLQDCHQWGTCAQQGMTHPISCTDMNCAWQYYSGTSPIMYGGKELQPTCYQDQGPVDCYNVNWDTVVQCPNNYCGVVSVGGVLAYFAAYQTGSTYVPFAGPGSIFGTNSQSDGRWGNVRGEPVASR